MLSLKSDRNTYMNEWRFCKNNSDWGGWGDHLRDVLSTLVRGHQESHREKLENYYNGRFAKYQDEMSGKVDERRKESPLHRWEHDDEIAQIERDFCNDVYDEFMQYLIGESLIDKE